ncbi:maleylpyruvate isomerase family mycothiol-dependent enzyme [Wenjunlia tyrosinilytica]|nr:maleylpyruvate isomerase family mycothiol-dependent enzyme [Wenjunlia tyrosinilytica]
MPPRSRSYDPDRTRKAVLAQAHALRQAARGLDPERFADPTRLGDWTVGELIVHIALQTEALPRVLGEEPAAGPADLSPVRWARSTASLADRLDAQTRSVAGETPDPVARLDAAVEELDGALAGPLPDRLVHIWPGTLPVADFAVTRLVELVVHADDLAAATGVEVALDRQALAAVTRLLADAFADKAPGGAVELRVPPFAVVQCVAGPRHTRGTPPNVVETDPLTWLRLASGRLSWARAADEAHITASGERSDLSELLPVLG